MWVGLRFGAIFNTGQGPDPLLKGPNYLMSPPFIVYVHKHVSQINNFVWVSIGVKAMPSIVIWTIQVQGWVDCAPIPNLSDFIPSKNQQINRTSQKLCQERVIELHCIKAQFHMGPIVKRWQSSFSLMPHLATESSGKRNSLSTEVREI